MAVACSSSPCWRASPVSTAVTSQDNPFTVVDCQPSSAPSPAASPSSPSFANTTFWSNVVALLDALPSSAAPTGFASLSRGNGTDRAFVRGMCRQGFLYRPRNSEISEISRLPVVPGILLVPPKIFGILKLCALKIGPKCCASPPSNWNPIKTRF